jgi:hypothetical protein
MLPDSIKADQFLGALDGIAYLVDTSGVIVSIGQPNWNKFATENDAPERVNENQVRGRTLLSFVSGHDVQQSYRTYMDALLNGHTREIVFSYRCDAPKVRREMRMAITPLLDDGQPAAILFHSTMLEEFQRPPINLLDTAAMLDAMRENSKLPLVALCSYCHRVRMRAGDDTWAPVEDYYHNGGAERVRLSHGICPPCFAKVVEPMLHRHRA